jgi:hypothetical protein
MLKIITVNVVYFVYKIFNILRIKLNQSLKIISNKRIIFKLKIYKGEF